MGEEHPVAVCGYLIPDDLLFFLMHLTDKVMFFMSSLI